MTPLAIELGDKVLLPEFGGTEIDLEGEKFQLYRDLDFLGKMENWFWTLLFMILVLLSDLQACTVLYTRSNQTIALIEKIASKIFSVFRNWNASTNRN